MLQTAAEPGGWAGTGGRGAGLWARAVAGLGKLWEVAGDALGRPRGSGSGPGVGPAPRAPSRDSGTRGGGGGTPARRGQEGRELLERNFSEVPSPSGTRSPRLVPYPRYRGASTVGCVRDRALSQRLGMGSDGPGGVGGAAQVGQGPVEPRLGPSGPAVLSPCAAQPGAVPCWDPDGESCAGNGAVALAASTALLALTEGPSESCTKALSVGCVSGWEQRGALLQECEGRSGLRLCPGLFQQTLLTWSSSELCCKLLKSLHRGGQGWGLQSPRIPARGRARACPWQRRSCWMGGWQNSGLARDLFAEQNLKVLPKQRR